VFLAAATLAIGLLPGCGDSGPAPQAAGSANAAIGVVTAVSAIRPMGLEIEAVGTSAANESAEITSELSKKITAIRFNEGDLVRRGAVLVELDSDEARADLAEAEAALLDSENQFKRSRDLQAQQALSVAQLEQIEALLQGNRARLDAARARLADTVIRAGFTGRVGFRRVSVGTVVRPDTVITTLDDVSLIKLNFTVPETYLFMLKKGLPVAAVTPGLPNRTFQGKVTDLDSRVDPTTRSIIVRAQIPNPDETIRPGMFMTVTLRADEVPTLIVPEAAVVAEQGSTFLMVVNDGVVERRKVRLGRRRPGEVEILENLREGERVVVEGTQNIRDGSAVRESGAANPSPPAPT
jgi:membrane fusion protein (multidrug efflux system)